MLKTVFEMFFDSQQFDSATVGESVKSVSEKALFQAMNDLSQSTVAHTNVLYENLLTDPMDTVKRIYANFGWSFTNEYENILHDYLTQNALQRTEMIKKQSKSHTVLHHYTAEDFGLTKEDLSSGRFADYITKFNLHH